MPFCHKCGNRVTDTARFCNKCGAKVRQRVSAQHSTSSVSRREKIKPSFENVLKQKKPRDQLSQKKTPVKSQIKNQFNYNEFQSAEIDWFSSEKKKVMLQRLSTYISYIEDVKKETGKKLREARSKRYQVKKENKKFDSTRSLKSLKSAHHQLITLNESINSLEEEYNLLDDNFAQANKQAEKFRSETSSDLSEEKFMKIERLLSGSAEFFNLKSSCTKLKDHRTRQIILMNDSEDIIAATSEIENIIEHLNSLLDVLSDCERITSSYFRKDSSIQSLMEKEEILNARREMIQIKVSSHKIKAYLHSTGKNESTIDLSFIDMDMAFESFINDVLSNKGIKFKSEISELIFDINASLSDISDMKNPIDEEMTSIKTSTNDILEQLKTHSLTPSEPPSSFDEVKDLTETSSLEEPVIIDQITIDEKKETAIAPETEKDLVQEEVIVDESESLVDAEVSEKVSTINFSSDLEVESSINQHLRYSSRKIEKIGNEMHVTLMSGDIKKQLWTIKEETIEVSGEGATTRSDISLEIISKNREGTFNWSDPWKNIELIVHEDYLSKLKGRRLIAEQIYKMEGTVKISFSRSSKTITIFLEVAKTSANVKAASQTFKEMVYLASSI